MNLKYLVVFFSELFRHYYSVNRRISGLRLNSRRINLSPNFSPVCIERLSSPVTVAAAASTVRTAKNPLEEFFELDRSWDEDKHVVYARTKFHELREKSKANLSSLLKDFKAELALLPVAKVSGGAPNKLSKINVVRKSIAQVLTVISHNQKSALRDVSEVDSPSVR